MKLQTYDKMSHKFRRILALIAVFSLVIQPVYSLVSAVTAAAAPFPLNIIVPDTTSPSVPVGGSPHATYVTSNDFYYAWGAATDDQPGQLTYEFQSATANLVDSNGSLVGAWNSITNGNAEQNHLVTPTMHSTGSPDGVYYWQVRVIDASDNKSAWSSVWNVTIDTTTPVISTSIEDGQKIRDTTMLDLTTVEANPQGDAIRILDSDGNVVQAGGSPQEKYDPNNASNSFVYSWDSTKVPNGSYKVQLSATDAAGNIAPVVYRAVTVDNSPVVVEPPTPVVTIDKERQGRTITGVVSDFNAAFSVKIDDTTQNDMTIEKGGQTTGGYKWSLVLPASITSGIEHTIEVTASANGKTSVAAQLAFTLSNVDTTPGSGSGIFPVTTNDPLLEQLTVSLRQPFVIPSSFGTVPLTTATKSFTQEVSDSAALGVQTAKDPATDQNVKTAAVAATASGWKLLGLYWYWWMLLITVIVAVTTRLVGAAKRQATDLEY